jgi:hypothetical protein
MTSAQAAALRVKWNQLVDRLPCEHLNQEMESDDGRYWAGRYYCTACGELIVHP